MLFPNNLTVLLAGTFLLFGGASLCQAQETRPVEVRIEAKTNGFQLLRDGKPYFIRGAGGAGSLPKLKAAGGNSVRTWGADATLGAMLDEAQKQGMTVAVGIWLGHERHGFNYNNADQVAQQMEDVRQAVLRYRNHPAVLLWGLGNEMEGYAKGDNAAIWSAINNLAGMVKRLDPKHPTMTVVGEIGGDRIKNIHRLCPDIDIVGINSYAGGPSIPKRYREAGGTKPYILTEFGPPGTWEVPKTAWGAIIEPTSTAKAASYRRTYVEAIANEPLCLGAYAFTWGNKQEATATWFGMLLPDGTKLNAVDTLTELWTGQPPKDLCPTIAALKLDGPEQTEPGAVVKATLDASDPAGKPLMVQWILQAETAELGTGGDAEAMPATFPKAIRKADNKTAEIQMPADGGGYRLFACVRNANGAAVANVPLFVKGPMKSREAPIAKLPLVIYDEADRTKPAYLPTGWMGNVKAIALEPACKTDPHTGKTCLRVYYAAENEWGGVVWQNPENDWGDKPGGWNLTGAKQLIFWARGDKGGEVVTFKFGVLGKEKKFSDTAQGQVENVTLEKGWKEYKIALDGKDLSRLKTGFVWTVAGQGKPLTFYLDDIRFE